MKKVAIGLLLILLVVGLYFGLTTTSLSVEGVTTTEENIELALKEEDEKILSEEFLDVPEENLSVLDIDKELELEKKLVFVQTVEPEISEDAIDIMVEASMSDVEKAFPSKKGIKPVVAINLPQNSIKGLKVGETISLPNMGDGQFDAKVANKTTNNNGSVTIAANIIDTGNQYSVVLTEGKNMTFGTVSTPNGSFEIEVKDGIGYIYDTDDIDNAWIDYGKTDTLDPHEH